MKKYIRKWIKEEKRIIRLCWQKGLIKPEEIKELYWAYYKYGNRQRRRKRKYAFRDYLPEVHFSTTDYWGECDEYALLGSILAQLYWENAEWVSGTDPYSTSSFKYQGRIWFIKYLENLPTVTRSSKINKVLIRNGDY